MYDINELLANFMPFFCVPLFILILNTVFRIVKILCQGEWIIETKDKSEPERSGQIRAEPAKVSLKKDTLDSDLKKYFNYDVKR